jgi:hypothetical protein
LLFWGAEHYTLDPYGFLSSLAVHDHIEKAVASLFPFGIMLSPVFALRFPLLTSKGIALGLKV